jgi:hypothetical protein
MGVLGRDFPDKGIVRMGDKFVQKFDYGYMKATSPNGRAHFYAPVKRIGRWEIDTFWFNIAVIWIESVLLYVALCFNLFKKGMDWLGNIRFGKIDTPQ